jgi:hypothetical protein
MPNPVAAFPDDELALLQYLRSVPEIVTLVPAAQITTELPNLPVYPHVLVQRIGGQAIVRQAIDEPVLQVDVLGGTKRQCKVLAQTIESAILGIANDVVGEGVLSSGWEEVGPQWLPDTVTVPPTPRYVARYHLITHK